MKIEKLDIDGLFIIEPKIFGDERGAFFESFNKEKFDEVTGTNFNFVQDNQSLSQKGVLRGLHFQKPPFEQGKLVRVIRGSVLDVAVDIRKNSPTFGKHHAVLLSGKNNKQFWIPPGFAHGFLALEDDTIFAYKCTNYYAPQSEGCIIWNDEQLEIDWQVENPIVSGKDQEGEEFRTFISDF